MVPHNKERNWNCNHRLAKQRRSRRNILFIQEKIARLQRTKSNCYWTQWPLVSVLLQSFYLQRQREYEVIEIILDPAVPQIGHVPGSLSAESSVCVNSSLLNLQHASCSVLSSQQNFSPSAGATHVVHKRCKSWGRSSWWTQCCRIPVFPSCSTAPIYQHRLWRATNNVADGHAHWSSFFFSLTSRGP